MTSSVRRPQQDRSRATRERLLASTIEMLATKGWAVTTVAAVAEAAGVSRGAAQHHFPTRESLITAALDQMFEELTVSIGASMNLLPGGSDRIEAVVERAVTIYTGVPFKAALQVWAAAASDPDLREQILPREEKFARAAHRITMAGFDPTGENPKAHRLAQATLDLARGLGLADTLSDDSRRRAQVVATWCEQVKLGLAQ